MNNQNKNSKRMKVNNNSLSYRELAENFVATKSEADYLQLYKKVKPGLRSYIFKTVKDSAAAEDILTNTLTKLWTKIEQYDPQYQITTWLYRIAFNECLGWIRERNRKYSLDSMQEFGLDVEDSTGRITSNISELMEDYEMKSEADYLAEDAELDRMYESTLIAMDKLKPIYKNILVDRIVNEMKYEDLADKYKLPLQTIKNRIRRGRLLVIEMVEA
jgi:RNA polymerase sigma-70 factor (ECF subfamily)